MMADELRRRKSADPFVPFTITLKDGRQVPVKGYWSFMISPEGSSVVATHEEVDVDCFATHMVARVTDGIPVKVS